MSWDFQKVSWVCFKVFKGVSRCLSVSHAFSVHCCFLKCLLCVVVCLKVSSGVWRFCKMSWDVWVCIAGFYNIYAPDASLCPQLRWETVCSKNQYSQIYLFFEKRHHDRSVNFSSGVGTGSFELFMKKSMQSISVHSAEWYVNIRNFQ